MTCASCHNFMTCARSRGSCGAFRADGSASAPPGAPEGAGRPPPPSSSWSGRRPAPGRPVLDGLAQLREEPFPGDLDGELSKSVAKAPIASERRRRIVDIPRFFSRPIPARSAFATDLDKSPPRIVPGAPCAPPRPHSTRTVGEDNSVEEEFLGNHRRAGGDSPGGPVSATPLSLYFALPPSATPLFLVQRRAKGCGAGGERYAPATFLSRRADRRRPRTDRRDRPGRENAGVAGRPGHEGTRAWATIWSSPPPTPRLAP